MGQILGVLFDSGDTLVRPKAGSWFPRQHFVEAFDAHGITGVHMDRFDAALAAGVRYLDEHHHEATTEDVEMPQFRAAYRLIVNELGVPSSSERLIAEILSPFEEDIGIEPFPDTILTLQLFRKRGLKLGIVSDNWPSLDRRYRELGLRDFFDTFVISALVGCSKPCQRMYRTAIEQIGLAPDSLMFVDDRVVNVDAAIREGMRGVVITRYGESVETTLPVVSNLEDLVDLAL